MQEQLLVELENAGHRISEMVRRFAGNEMICITLIKKFPKDPNFDLYKKQVHSGNYEEAENSVHTLKGVSSNLGLTKITEITQLILDDIRAGKYDNLNELTEQLEVSYHEAVEIIEKYM